MARFKNIYNVNKIFMKKRIHNLCTIGQDWFTNNLEITMIPGETIPDYIEVDEMIQKYDEKEFIIEEVINNIIEELKQYNPKYIKVVSNVNDAKHLEVSVEGEYFGLEEDINA